MTSRHRLKHIYHFGAAHLANNNPVWTHAQRVAHQVALGDFSLAFQVGRTRFQAHHMRLLQRKFRRILDSDDAFIGWDKTGQTIKHSGLARTSSATDYEVKTRPYNGLEKLNHFVS